MYIGVIVYFIVPNEPYSCILRRHIPTHVHKLVFFSVDSFASVSLQLEVQGRFWEHYDNAYKKIEMAWPQDI